MNAREWNALHPVGTRVAAYPGTRDDAPLLTRTRSEAWELGHGAAVVKVEGHAGGIALTHVDAMTELEQLQAEIARVRAERDAYCDRVDTLTAVAKGNKWHVSEMYADLQKAHAERDELRKRIANERAEVLREAKTEVVSWLFKKAREYRSTSSSQHALQADAIERMASKIDRGAVRLFLTADSEQQLADEAEAGDR